MRNVIAPLSEAWGASGHALLSRLSALDDDQAVANALTEALLDRPKGRWNPDALEIITWMRQHAWDISIPDVVAHSGWSQRQLLRIFDHQVGLTPKTVLRILRFRAIIASLHDDVEPDWVDTASRAGYTDQSHMIADFVKYTGMTPTQLVGCRSLGMILTHDMLFMPRGLDPSTLDPSVVAPRNRARISTA